MSVMFDLAACPLCGTATDNVFCGGCSRDAAEWERMNGGGRGYEG
jgi:hypothetical protein